MLSRSLVRLLVGLAIMQVVLAMAVSAAPASKKKVTVKKALTSVKAAVSTSTKVTLKATVTASATVKPTSVVLSATSSAASAIATMTSSKTRGVNLGGWFILERWMSPSFFNTAASQSGNSALTTSGDQWTFMTSFTDQSKAAALLKQHWSTWIVEADFAKMKAIGLNTVRLPVPHWAFVASSGEPYLALAEQPYISSAIKLAAKYGLGVILDMHTAPGSQNGYDSSGHTGTIGFRNDNGTANAQILNTALANMVKLYVNDPQYSGIVKSIEILNEPLCSSLGADYMTGIYYTAYNTIQSAIASNAITKPSIVMHDCFIEPFEQWSPAVSSGGGLANQQFTLDAHRYQVFAPYVNLTLAQHVAAVKSFGSDITSGQKAINRPILVGEFSLAISCTDCVPAGSNAAQIATVNRQWFETQTSAYENGVGWIFWSWVAEGPNYPWSFKDAYAANWIPAMITAKNEAL